MKLFLQDDHNLQADSCMGEMTVDRFHSGRRQGTSKCDLLIETDPLFAFSLVCEQIQFFFVIAWNR